MQIINKNARSFFVLPALVLALVGCSSESDVDFEQSVADQQEQIAQVVAASPPEALFSPDPSAPVLPFPTNLLFNGSTDGTLDIPIPEAEQELTNPVFVLNQLDGFSTVAPITTPVSKPLNSETLILGDTVRVLEVVTPEGPIELRSAVAGSVGEITDPEAMRVEEINGQIILTPLVPLKPSTSYMVVLTDGIQDIDGQSLQASRAYNLAKGDRPLTNPRLEMELGELQAIDAPTAAQQQRLADISGQLATLGSLEGLRQLIQSHLAVLNTQLNIEPANLALSWVFTTQSIREVLQAVKDISAPSTLVLGSTNTPTPEAGGSRATIYIGALDLPYYQTVAEVDGDPSAALDGFWANSAGNVPGATDADGVPDYTPMKTVDVKVPVIMTVPNDNSAGGGQMPAGGWPVTIFQHGITGNRTQMLGIADAMANAGRVLIAIDMPLHGLTDNTLALHAANNPFGPAERTFNIDILTETVGEAVPMPGPDQVPDSSGRHFLNLTNLANSRDNLRQAVADLFVLSASLSQAQVEGVTLDVNNLTFIGHSLGGIVGTTMLSYDNTFDAATLGMPGGGIALLLATSDNFGPVINAGLAEKGVEANSADYFQFLNAAQAMVDSGDPINHAATLAASGDTQLHLIEVIGDMTVPNGGTAVAPLSGTEPLIRQLGLPNVREAVAGSNAAVRFIEGDHASLLSPAASLPATIEMQTQTAAFAQSQGTALPITNADVLQEVTP